MLVWAIRQPTKVQTSDTELIKALKEKYAKIKSQEAYQQDWSSISQQPGEKFDDYYNRLEVAYDNVYRDPEFREPKSIGILDDTGKLKDSLVIIGIAKMATEVGDLLKTGATTAEHNNL